MIERRNFLIQCAASAVATAAIGRLAAQTLRHDPFLLGVASGSPAVDGMVLWTRLMASPVGEPLPAAPIEVQWELASDPQFKRIVKAGTEFAQPDFAHSLHVEVSGLESPSQASKSVFYWYRFIVATQSAPWAARAPCRLCKHASRSHLRWPLAKTMSMAISALIGIWRKKIWMWCFLSVITSMNMA